MIEITSDSWKYRNMVTASTNLARRLVFVISTISSLGFGAIDPYRNQRSSSSGDLDSFVEKSAHETCRTSTRSLRLLVSYSLDKEGREKLYRNILLYDAYKFGNDNTEGKATESGGF